MDELRLSSTGSPSDPQDPRRDPRVAMVLEVLAGADLDDVARRWVVDAGLIRRWVRGFVDGGSAVVTNRPLASAAQERDRFLAAFAHELRTPVTIARAWVDTLLVAPPPPQLLERGLDALATSLTRLTERIIDVELLAAASLGRIRVDLDHVDTTDVVAGLPADVAVDIHQDLGQLRVDPALFPRLLRDVCQAASIAPVPRSLRLEAFPVAGWAEVRVTRVGEPLDPTTLHSMFEPFGTDNPDVDKSGITIGLYLARALAVAHGGTIGLEQDDTTLAIWVRVPHAKTLRSGRTDVPSGPRRLSMAPDRPSPADHHEFSATGIDARPIHPPHTPTLVGLTTGDPS